MKPISFVSLACSKTNSPSKSNLAQFFPVLDDDIILEFVDSFTTRNAIQDRPSQQPEQLKAAAAEAAEEQSYYARDFDLGSPLLYTTPNRHHVSWCNGARRQPTPWCPPSPIDTTGREEGVRGEEDKQPGCSSAGSCKSPGERQALLITTHYMWWCDADAGQDPPTTGAPEEQSFHVLSSQDAGNGAEDELHHQWDQCHCAAAATAALMITDSGGEILASEFPPMSRNLVSNCAPMSINPDWISLRENPERCWAVLHLEPLIYNEVKVDTSGLPKLSDRSCMASAAYFVGWPDELAKFSPYEPDRHLKDRAPPPDYVRGSAESKTMNSAAEAIADQQVRAALPVWSGTWLPLSLDRLRVSGAFSQDSFAVRLD